MSKKIYFEPAGRVHSTQRRLFDFPPDGYEFVLDKTTWDKAINPILRSDSMFLSSSLGRRTLEAVMPLNLAKAYLEGIFKRPRRDTDLTYSYNHVIFRNEPWVVNVEWAHVLVGRNFGQFPRYRRLVEKMLASPNCKKVLTWCELVKKNIELIYDCSKFEDKMEIVELAAAKKDFTKEYNNKRTRFLYVSSADASGDVFWNFDYKGGKEVLRVFDALYDKYKNVELVIRGDIPGEVSDRYEGHPGIRFIEKPIPLDDLNREFMEADVFFLPTHGTPWGAILEAMSWELPILTINARANSQLVENEVTGLVIECSKNVPYFTDTLVPLGATSEKEKLHEAIKLVDERVVSDLTEKASLLVETPEFRRKLGKNARHEVDKGRFSIQKRNKVLKKIFDEVTAE